MRLRQLFEASYDSMIAKMKQDFPEHQQLIQEYLKMAKVIFKKDDKIVWWMKNVRQTLTDIANNHPAASLEELHSEFENITHYFGYGEAAFDNYQFGNKSYVQIINDFDKLEQQFQKKQEQDAPVAVQQGDYELIRFTDGISWWFVDRAYCSDEGRSGGHCGNVVGQHNKAQRILSLRKNGHVILTFILEPDGSLGEMKAKHNQKPNEKYHPYIMSLLLSDTVKGIKGAGYLPENNFSVFDLADKNLKAIHSSKAELISDQLMAEPMEFFKAPNWIRSDSHYQMIAKNNLQGINEIMDEKGALTTDIKSWQKAVARNKSLILHVPDNYPNLENELIFYLSRKPEKLLQASKKITNNKKIMMQIVEKNSETLAYILPTNPHYSELALAAIQQDGWALNEIPREQITEPMAKLAVQQNGETLQIVPEQLLTEEIVKLAIYQNSRVIRTVEDPNLITLDVIKAAYAGNQRVIEWWPDWMYEHPNFEKFAMYGIQQDIREFFEIPKNDRTYKICKYFVEHYTESGDASITFVPDQFKPKLYKSYLENSNYLYSLAKIPEEDRTLELCKIAVDKQAANISYVPAELKPKIRLNPVIKYINANHPNINAESLEEDEIRKILVKDYINLAEPNATAEQKQQAYTTLIDMKIDVDDVLKFIKKRENKNES